MSGTPPTQPRILTREEILNADDLKLELVLTPEWGEGSAVYARGMNGHERDVFELSMVRIREEKDGRKVAEATITQMRLRLVASSTCDSEGNPLFTLDDVTALSAKNAAPLARIADVVQRLSGMEGTIEEATAELGKDPNAASGSDSLSPSDEPLANSSE